MRLPPFRRATDTGCESCPLAGWSGISNSRGGVVIRDEQVRDRHEPAVESESTVRAQMRTSNPDHPDSHRLAVSCAGYWGLRNRFAGDGPPNAPPPNE